MNSEFKWGMIVAVLSIIIIGIAIGLYLFWKDKKDYDSDKKIIVWSVVAAGSLALLFGIIFIIWGATKKETTDTTTRSVVQSQIRTEELPLPPPPVMSPPKAPPIIASTSVGPLRAKDPGPKKLTLKTTPVVKKVTFSPPGDSSSKSSSTK